MHVGSVIVRVYVHYISVCVNVHLGMQVYV